VYLAIILFIVAVGNAFIDFYQQYRTAAILESFLSLVPPETTVIRGRALKSASAAAIVKGDVLYLKAGDKIPADCRLFSVTDMKVDNSSITGESEAQERSLLMTIENPLEAQNLVFSGTMVTNGEGYGIVIRTGDRSILGQIAKLTIGEKTPPSQLTKEINFFVRIIAVIAIVTAVVFFIVGLVLGYDIGITFSFAIGIFVAYVPQGLPVTVSVR
jgi:sodium/potassium-transporting ATPase subunit alpha